MAATQNAPKRHEWKCLGSDKEIAAENGYEEKSNMPSVEPPSKVHFTARRELFIKRRSQHNYITKEANEDFKDVRGIPNPNSVWEVFRQECDTGVQAVKSTSETSAQTQYYRQVHACVQAQPTLVDARLEYGKAEDEDAQPDPKMGKFLDKVMPRMIHHLVQNNEVPIFGDDYVRLADEDTFVGSRDDSFVKEIGNFTHPYIKDRQITSIDWNTGPRQILAVTSIANKGMTDRIQYGLHVESSVCLVWNLTEDQMHPQFILESPFEVQVIRLSPVDPNIIVGGCMNGQIVQWDTTRVVEAKQVKQPRRLMHTQHQEQDVREIPPMPHIIPGHSLEREGDADVSRLLPSKVSRVEASHKQPVQDICWLPVDLKCAWDGKMTPADDRTRGKQFATISTDGVVYIWDLDPENLHPDKLRKMKHQTKAGGEDKPWVPMIKYQLQRPDGTGDVLGFRVHIEGYRDNVPSYLMVCTSEDGELCICNIAPKEDRVSQQQQFGGDAGKTDTRLVRSVIEAHSGPAYAVQRHPLIADTFLTCGDWGFKVWRAGLPSAVLASPHTSSRMMCARWSPTRASVLLVGTADGKIQVWDLLDRSHEPVLVHQVIPDAITAIEFKHVTEKRGATQIVALGTKKGTFHLYGLPKVLTKAHNHEKYSMKGMLDREVRRVAYFQWRWRERQKEVDHMVQDTGKMEIGAGGGDLGKGGKRDEHEEENDEDDDFYVTADTETEFNALVQDLEDQEEEDES